MSRKIRTDAGSQASLALLLDVLASELLAAPDHEVAVALWELGATERNALKIARQLVNSLNDAPDTQEAPKVIVPRTRAYLWTMPRGKS